MTRRTRSKKSSTSAALPNDKELVVITGMSGSGKASTLKAFEDLGYYCVDNLPVELIRHFADLTQHSDVRIAAIVVDIREGEQLKKLPGILKSLREMIKSKVIFLEASDEALIRRFSETRRPHPLGTRKSVRKAIQEERSALGAIRQLADIVIDTSNYNVHELRQHAIQKFKLSDRAPAISVSLISFGYKHGIPQDCDLLFDVRFLPNPHFIPELRPYTGRHPKVARYVKSFPQTLEFIRRISKLLIYLLPHYVKEGKSYLTIGFGCTGGQHRSVLIAEEIRKHLDKAGYEVHVTHRDS